MSFTRRTNADIKQFIPDLSEHEDVYDPYSLIQDDFADPYREWPGTRNMRGNVGGVIQAAAPTNTQRRGSGATNWRRITGTVKDAFGVRLVWGDYGLAWFGYLYLAATGTANRNGTLMASAELRKDFDWEFGVEQEGVSYNVLIVSDGGDSVGSLSAQQGS